MGQKVPLLGMLEAPGSWPLNHTDDKTRCACQHTRATCYNRGTEIPDESDDVDKLVWGDLLVQNLSYRFDGLGKGRTRQGLQGGSIPGAGRCGGRYHLRSADDV